MSSMKSKNSILFKGKTIIKEKADMKQNVKLMKTMVNSGYVVCMLTGIIHYSYFCIISVPQCASNKQVSLFRSELNVARLISLV